MIAAYKRKKAEQLMWVGVLQKQVPGRNCCNGQGAGQQCQNCPGSSIPLPPLDLADKLPASTRLPPEKPAFAGSYALTAWGWACTVAAIVGFFITVYLRA